jgi:hypothetical protein
MHASSIHLLPANSRQNIAPLACRLEAAAPKMWAFPALPCIIVGFSSALGLDALLLPPPAWEVMECVGMFTNYFSLEP